MNSDFKKFFSSTMGIVAAIGIVIVIGCACCLILSAIGKAYPPPTPTATPAAVILFYVG
jgi:hypothetical protein